MIRNHSLQYHASIMNADQFKMKVIACMTYVVGRIAPLNNNTLLIYGISCNVYTQKQMGLPHPLTQFSSIEYALFIARCKFANNIHTHNKKKRR